MHWPQKLLQNSNIIVKGRLYETPWYDEEKKEAGTIECIELDFIIQVNGKIIDFTESFTLSESEVSGELSIDQWDNWYLIVRILSSMGYILSEDNKRKPFDIYEEMESNSIIKKWVRMIKN